MRDNEKLLEMIHTHEQMEKFYIEEISRHKKANKQLEWRLNLLREELNNNGYLFSKGGREGVETMTSWRED